VVDNVLTIHVRGFMELGTCKASKSTLGCLLADRSGTPPPAGRPLSPPRPLATHEAGSHGLTSWDVKTKRPVNARSKES